MRKVILLWCILITAIGARAQFLTQSADGKSSIPLPLKGVGVSVDIGKADATIGVNNYAKVLGETDSAFKNHILYGISLSGKTAGGLSNLFSAGNIVPEGNLLAFLGCSWSNNGQLLRDYNNGMQQGMINSRIQEENRLLNTYQSRVAEIIKSSEIKIADDDFRKKVVPELILKVKAAATADKVNSSITDYAPGDKRLDEFFKDILDKRVPAWQAFINSFNELQKTTYPLDSLYFRQYISSAKPWRISTFLLGGIQARSFTRYLGLNATSFSKSFQDTLFRGGSFGIGINAQYRNYWLGATYSYQAGDNFSNLASKDYNIHTADTIGSQVLSSEKKINAYPGSYGHVESNLLNIDLVAEYKLGDTSRILVNPYLRASLFSRDTSLLTNYINIGLGFYFIGKKSKLLGGLYIELPDINNNAEKAKPADQINVRSPFKKLSIGVVTKISLSSIFNYSDPPVPQ